MLEYEDPNPHPSLPPEPSKIASFWVFLSKNPCKSILQKEFFHGEINDYDVYKTPHTILHPFFMEMDLKSKFSKKISEPKTPKGGIFKGQRRKEEDLSP